ncbi:MAG: hypothetical protein QOH26_1462 [Actinomycetota bacterium]|nr:hypothetical protein [Actinomycetota bacterium]
MRIEATCEQCGRRFLLSQIGPESETPGRCPFCGHRFARHYAGVLMETVENAERAANQFVQMLSRLQNMETGFRVDLDGLLRELSEEAQSNEQRPAS